MNDSFTNLGLTDVSAPATSAGGGTCGGDDCMCGAAPSAAAVPVAAPASATQEFLVTGMTCGHCVSSVTEELSELDGVDRVAVELNVGGSSKIEVSASAPLDIEKVRAAVAEAGYELVGTSA